MTLQPTSPKQLQEIVHAQAQADNGRSALRPRGGGSKPALSTPPDGAAALEMSSLSGILEYQPSEYTFTAYAGTAVAAVAAALAENGQYMPFDPLLAEAGATLGGVVAANTSGSGRFRFGGVRDFILGVRFVDGRGQLVRGGGKVVKNSAGFDLPKFFVGSLGRYGVLVEVTFKVFPQPPAYQTLRLTYLDLDAALRATFRLAQTPLEMDAVDLMPQNGHYALLLRVGGLAAALPARITRLTDFLTTETPVQATAVFTDDGDAQLWQAANRCEWAGGAPLVKIPLPPKQAPLLDARLGDAPRRYTAAANVAWVATPDTAALHHTLTELNLTGLQLTGAAAQPILGARPGLPLAHRVKQALDPQRVFVDDD